MKKIYSLQLTLLFILSVAYNSFSQPPATCPYTGPVDFEQKQTWPTHSKWYFGQAQILDFGATGTAAPTVSTKVGVDAPYFAYESATSVADENGDLVFYSNGVDMWDENGVQIPVPGGRLLTGSEDPVAGTNGSAVQGILTVKHPLNDEEYYIFTTDDALLGQNTGITNGFNYYVYNSTTNTVTGPTRLGGYRSTEQVAATWHNNGIDIWIVSHESVEDPATTQRYNAYLLSCDGLEETPVTSDEGFEVKYVNAAGGFANERASLVFAPSDGSQRFIKAAATHHNGGGTWDPVNSVSVLDFDNLDGTFAFDRGLGDGTVAHSNPYSCEFTASGNRLYVTFQSDQWTPLNGRVGYFNVGGGAFNQLANTSNTRDIAFLKLGGDGNIYGGGFEKNPFGYLDNLTVITNPDGAANANTTGFATANDGVGYGLPNMFVPPQDWVEIQDTTGLTDCDLPYDFSTEWLCKGTDAENTPLYENAYSIDDGCVGCTIDPVTGVFNAPGPGSYRIRFEICDIWDTLTINIGSCNCDVDIDEVELDICAGDSILLDDYFNSSSQIGEWEIDSTPAPMATAPNIVYDNGDSLFVSANNTTPGTYKVIYSVNNKECYDSLYITVKPIPVADIEQFGPLCSDSLLTLMVGTPTHGADTTGTWFINGIDKAQDNTFDPINDNDIIIGDNIVEYAVDVNGCVDTAEITVEVKERVVIDVDSLGPFCTNDPTVIYTAAPDSGTWNITAGETIGANGSFNPGNAGQGTYDIWHTVSGQCGASDTVEVVINAVKDASISTPDSTLCEGDPALQLLALFPGGTWFDGDTSDINNELAGGLFDPANYTAGVYDVYYVQYDPCGDIDTVEITVEEIEDASFTASKTVYCAQDDSVQFIPTNTGGTWSGAGIDPNTGWFNPANGTDDGNPYQIYYEIDGNCPHIDSVEVTVNANKDATILNYPAANDSLTVCALDLDPTFNTQVAGGTWNNANVVSTGGTGFEIDLDGLTNNQTVMVNNEMLIYSFPNPCEDSDTVWITTTNQLDATVDQPDPVCDGVDSVQITRPNNVAGTWSADCGTCINSVTGMFYPTISGDGNFDITYTIAGNCGDTDTKTIQVDRTPDPTITSNGGDTIKQCIDEPVINLTSVEAGGTWEQIGAGSGLDAAGATFDPNVSGGGTFDVRYVFGNPCPVADTLTIFVDTLPIIEFDFDTAFCDNEAALDLGVTPTGGVWSGDGITDVNAGTFDPDGATTVKGTNAVPGENNISYTVTVGLCSATSNDIIEVIEAPDATIDPVGPFCNSDSTVQLNAADPNGVWSSYNGIAVDATDGDFNTLGLNPGNYNVVYFIAGTCPARDTIEVEIIGPKDPTITQQNPICLGDANSITFDAVEEGDWYGDVDANGVLAVADSGTYTIINEIDEICYVADTIEFTVNYVPDVDFEADIINGCVGFTESFVDLTNTDGSGPVVQSLWDFGNGLTSTSLINTTAPYNQAGTYSVSLTNTYANGCSSSYTIPNYITAYPFPNADFTWEPDNPSLLENTVNFINLSDDAITYEWTFESSRDIPANTQFEPIISLPTEEADTVFVTLMVTSINGCRDTIIKPVPVLDFFNIFVPNAFTPGNEDGLNDRFFPVGRNISPEDYEFMIFNRWGELIWQTNQLGEGWDGTVQGGSGNEQQIDVYVWKLNVTDAVTGDRKEMVGTVTLVR